MRCATTHTCFVALVVSLTACEDEAKTSAPKSRRDAVLSAAASPVVPVPKSNAAAGSPSAERALEPAASAKPRQLCSVLEDPGTGEEGK